jgi:hypothetical protein
MGSPDSNHQDFKMSEKKPCDEQFIAGFFILTWNH